MFGLKLKDTMKKILIVCTGNSCRSQMAEAWMRKFAGDKAQVFSAGTHPEKVNPIAIKVMQMEYIDISHHKSNLVDDYITEELDYLIIGNKSTTRKINEAKNYNVLIINEDGWNKLINL